MQILKLHWNFTDKKWNLIEIGTEIPKGSYERFYVVPAEVNFIDPTKSILVRLSWRVHLFFIKYMPNKNKKTIMPQSCKSDVSKWFYCAAEAVNDGRCKTQCFDCEDDEIANN